MSSTAHVSIFVRLLRGATILAAGLWTTYVLVANLFLNLGGLEAIGEFQEIVEMRLGGGWTVWPGRVTGESFDLVVHDSNVELHLHVDRFETNIELLSAFQGRFETTTASVTGVLLHLRMTRTVAELCKQEAGLPDIPGMAKPNELSDGPCEQQPETSRTSSGKPSPPDDHVRVKMAGVKVHGLKDLWIEQFRTRVEGYSDIEGAWAFWPTVEMNAHANRIEIRGARLTVNDKTRMKGTDITGSAKLEPLKLAETDADKAWSAISADLTMRVPHVQLSLLSQTVSVARPVAPPSMPKLSGLVSLTATVSVHSGHLDKARAHIVGRQVRALLLSRALSGRVQADLSASTGADGAVQLHEASVQLTDPRLHGDGQVRDFPGVTLGVRTQVGSVVVPRKKMAHLALVARANRAGILLELVPGGAPRFAAEVIVSDDAPATVSVELHASESGASLDNMDLQVDGLRVQGRLQLTPEPGGALKFSYGGLSMTREL